MNRRDFLAGAAGSAVFAAAKLGEAAYTKPLSTFPTTGGYRGFGVKVGTSYHNGADYKCTVGTKVFAVADGDVVYSGEYAGFGALSPSKPGGAMVLRHRTKTGATFFAVYGHLDLYFCAARVTRGTVIGTIRSFYNGKDFLPHLHLGVFVGKTFPTSGWGYSTSLTDWRDPKPYLDANV